MTTDLNDTLGIVGEDSPLGAALAQFQQALGSVKAGASTTADPYQLALQQFLVPAAEVTGGVNRAAMQHGVGYQESPTGQIRYVNGVIADPIGGTVVYPPGDPSVEGSEAWLRSIQDDWGEKQANTWRKRLSNQGYEVAETGGWAMDLVNALRTYHQARYINYGKAIPLTPKDKASRAAQIRKQIDPVALKEEVKTWGQVPFDEDLDPDTAEYFADRVIDVAARLAKKHPEWTPAQVIGTPSSQYGPATGAYLRVEKEFAKAPGVRGALREEEEDEMDESLRNNIISISQLGSV